MKKITYLLVITASILVAGCSKKTNQGPVPQPVAGISGPKVAIALGGNAFVTAANPGFTESIDDSGNNGLTNWTGQNSVISIYFKVVDTGAVNLFLRTKVDAGATSQIKVTINGQSIAKQINNATIDTIKIGKFDFNVKGYYKVDIQGVSKTGSNYGVITDLVLQNPNVTNSLLYVKENSNSRYYYGRRGPSVHLFYNVPAAAANVEWFYNEVTVPVGQDPIGSYFQSNGFDGGYFGMQVNSATERRILFSTFDPANGTDVTTRIGPNVVSQRFGGEGTGGQTYLDYNWKAGNTYKFLTHAQPDGAGNTLYSAWFFAPELNAWQFIATAQRPESVPNKYLTGLYSFVENFIDDNGYLGRSAQFGNGWVKSSTGTWFEVTSAQFNGDDIGNVNYRLDYAGGISSNNFYLQNGGFFSNNVPLNTTFIRPASNVSPVIDFNALP